MADSTTTPSNSNRSGSSFPFKTLIWALLALVAIFLFKNEIKGMLNDAEKLTLFGIEIQTGKETAAKLEAAAAKYNDQITALMQEISNQQMKIENIEELKKQLEENIPDCPEAQKTADLINANVQDMVILKKDIRLKSNVLKDIKIFKRNAVMAK